MVAAKLCCYVASVTHRQLFSQPQACLCDLLTLIHTSYSDTEPWQVARASAKSAIGICLELPVPHQWVEPLLLKIDAIWIALDCHSYARIAPPKCSCVGCIQISCTWHAGGLNASNGCINALHELELIGWNCTGVLWWLKCIYDDGVCAGNHSLIGTHYPPKFKQCLQNIAAASTNQVGNEEIATCDFALETFSRVKKLFPKHMIRVVCITYIWHVFCTVVDRYSFFCHRSPSFTCSHITSMPEHCRGVQKVSRATRSVFVLMRAILLQLHKLPWRGLQWCKSVDMSPDFSKLKRQMNSGKWCWIMINCSFAQWHYHPRGNAMKCCADMLKKGFEWTFKYGTPSSHAR